MDPTRVRLPSNSEKPNALNYHMFLNDTHAANFTEVTWVLCSV
jgi:hypothetical protein